MDGSEHLPLLALPAPLLVTIISLLDDWADRKALRTACRALRNAVDEGIAGATLKLSDIAALPDSPTSSAAQILRRLRRLTIQDACEDASGYNEQYGEALALFGAAHLFAMTQLTRMEVSGPTAEDELATDTPYRDRLYPSYGRSFSAHNALVNFKARGAAVFRLLASMPASLREVSVDPRHEHWNGREGAVDVLKAIVRCTELCRLELPACFSLQEIVGEVMRLAMRMQRLRNSAEMVNVEAAAAGMRAGISNLYSSIAAARTLEMYEASCVASCVDGSDDDTSHW